MNNQDLAREAIRAHAVRYGDFTLASGAKSNIYIDCRQVTLRRECMPCLANGLRDLAQQDEPLALENCQAIGGLAVGAVPLAILCALYWSTTGNFFNVFFVRKEAKDHGTRQVVEGPLTRGAKVLLVEDVVTSGESVLAAARAVQEQYAATILGVLCLVDRGGLAQVGQQLGCPARCLLSLQDLQT